MGTTTAISGMVFSGINASNQYSAYKAQGKMAEATAEINARYAEEQGKDAIKRGEKEAAQYGKKVRGVVGAQRAGYAGSGIDVNSGSALEVQADTEAIAREDMEQIKNNAWREAWGYKAQASNMRMEGQIQKFTAGNMARNSIISGVGDMIGYGAQAYANMPKGKKGTSSGGGNVSGGSYKNYGGYA